MMSLLPLKRLRNANESEVCADAVRDADAVDANQGMKNEVGSSDDDEGDVI